MPPRSLLTKLNTLPTMPYRLPIASYTAPVWDLSRIAAVHPTASLVGRPPMVQVASVTRGVLRIRLTFHDFAPVMTSSRSPSAAAQIGTGLGRPSLVKVVSKMYCDLASWAKVGVTLSTYRELGAPPACGGTQKHPEPAVLGCFWVGSANSLRGEQCGEHTVRSP